MKIVYISNIKDDYENWFYESNINKIIGELKNNYLNNIISYIKKRRLEFKENWFYECIGEALPSNTPGCEVRLEYPRHTITDLENSPTNTNRN